MFLYKSKLSPSVGNFGSCSVILSLWFPFVFVVSSYKIDAGGGFCISFSIVMSSARSISSRSWARSSLVGDLSEDASKSGRPAAASAAEAERPGAYGPSFSLLRTIDSLAPPSS